ncbi:hypothetical protein IMG5_117950 [Ichthyophthirius multifiliis]|uniref:Uncharacterized protein n=1 Tax=Ichthyophthirius multifiliis TaxID=5932 RepID=G0QUM4_ICHMU|nr:hypothetical protein IMG5_117950 [Ichthyophthirius multifiliis]EGR31070.1 hypothetical protein IMG5_117950 [Ichthyophthirius multifiliis]|eukprot:XP_004034556.1 hypothetical protein IMG5_117950 [Ichthyophthirius multifiliis]
MDKQGYTTGTLSIANGTQALCLNPSTLKGRIKNIEEKANVLSDELSKHKKEFQVLKNEKETVEQVLRAKNQGIQNILQNEIIRLEEEMKRHYAHQRAEGNRIQLSLDALKSEKTALQQALNNIEQRINQLEYGVGDNEVQN